MTRQVNANANAAAAASCATRARFSDCDRRRANDAQSATSVASAATAAVATAGEKRENAKNTRARQQQSARSAGGPQWRRPSYSRRRRHVAIRRRPARIATVYARARALATAVCKCAQMNGICRRRPACRRHRRRRRRLRHRRTSSLSPSVAVATRRQQSERRVATVAAASRDERAPFDYSRRLRVADACRKTWGVRRLRWPTIVAK